MPEKFQNKYRIPSARLQNWDYGSNGSYFVTICTSDMQYHFGDVYDGEMHLSEAGILADTYWKEIPKKFPFVVLGEYVVMPNHMHGIIIIDGDGDGDCRDAINRVSTGSATEPATEPAMGSAMGPTTQPTTEQPTNPSTQHQPGGITGNKNPMLYDNLSCAIRWYKGRVAFEIHKINAGFAWQPRFHDHIIRDDASFQRITNYIKNNPSKWSDDKFYNR